MLPTALHFKHHITLSRPTHKYSSKQGRDEARGRKIQIKHIQKLTTGVIRCENGSEK